MIDRRGSGRRPIYLTGKRFSARARPYPLAGDFGRVYGDLIKRPVWLSLALRRWRTFSADPTTRTTLANRWAAQDAGYLTPGGVARRALSSDKRKVLSTTVFSAN